MGWRWTSGEERLNECVRGRSLFCFSGSLSGGIWEDGVSVVSGLRGTRIQPLDVYSMVHYDIRYSVFKGVSVSMIQYDTYEDILLQPYSR